MLLNGKDLASARLDLLKTRIQEHPIAQKLSPGLAVILVGEDPASQVYVKNKINASAKVGIRSFEFRLPANVEKQKLVELIKALNENREVHGILLQLPLPVHLPARELVNLISPEKDPDGQTVVNQGLLALGRPRVIACTPKGIMSLLNHYKIPLAGQSVVVVGRSEIVGRPMAQALLAADATVTICHSKTVHIEKWTRQADIVIVAAGKRGLLGASAFKQGAVVIDVGIHRMEIDGRMKLTGDVRLEELAGLCRAWSPVPGGVGPMTIVSLLENTFDLYLHSL